MNRYTYRDIFSSHKVAGPAVQAKKKKAEADAIFLLATQIEKLIKAFQPLLKGTTIKQVTTIDTKIPINNPKSLSLEINKQIKVLRDKLKNIIDREIYNKIVYTLNNFNPDLTEIQKTVKQIEAREAKAATAKK
jgi:hypothetical protein